jgi:hypothetical protein
MNFVSNLRLPRWHPDWLRLGENWARVLFLAAYLLLVVLIGPTVVASARLNHQMVELVSSALAARMEGNSVAYTPALQEIADRLASHHDQFASGVGSTMVTLALWADDPAGAYRWLR